MQDLDQLFIDGALFADQLTWHDTLKELRANSPIVHVEAEGYQPFYALTRHEDILSVERQPNIFANTLSAVLEPIASFEQRQASGLSIKTLIHMDGHEHHAYRGVTEQWFRASQIAALETRVQSLATAALDVMSAAGGSCDFMVDIARPFPLHVIMSILGVDPSDERRMMRLTQELFSPTDPELGRDEGTTDAVMEVLLDFFTYFQAMTANRRQHPGDDLATVIATGTVDSEPLGDLETVSYYTLVATAGHDTTSYSLAGGMLALLQNPEQLQMLRDDRSLIPNAVDEMIRWSSPVRQFTRTATQDTCVSGVDIAEGEMLLLSYPSGNRDEAVFSEPFLFDVQREHADKHLAFGFGRHFCLGASLARMELRIFLEEFLDRVSNIQLDGEASWSHSSFVSGVKHLPVRYEMAQ
ncbi:MAG: cytochrome P450 [Acidimicrobiales bacterium]